MSIDTDDGYPHDISERLARLETKQDQLITSVGEFDNLEVSERLGSIETKQDTIVEKIDQMADNVDQQVSELEADIDQNEKRTNQMYLGVRVLAWAGGSAGLLGAGISYMFF